MSPVPDGWAWLALLPVVPPGADLSAAAVDATSGEPAGLLVAWTGRDAGWKRPHGEALRCDPAVLAPDQGPWDVSWVVAPRRARPLFDDPAVVHAVRSAAAGSGSWTATTTLVVDDVHWAGAVTHAPRPVPTSWWADLPWSRLGVARRLTVEVGVLGAAVLPAGPSTQRRAGSPWPGGRWGIDT